MANYVIELKNVKKVYGTTIKTEALKNVNLGFEETSFTSIIGQSGSGKSTLLNIIGTLDKATEGTVLINGKDTSALNKNELSTLRNETIGFIFQFHYLLPEFTAYENVLMPVRISKQKITKEIEDRANELMELVGLTKVKNNLANNMSGGQQQRTAIARALMNQPKIILADEPTGNLDSDTTKQIYDLLRKINRELKTTFIIITHDRKVAQEADRIIEIKDGEVNVDMTSKQYRQED
jgi:lipoprotein-releasing system ATP-binding protein